MVRSCWRRTACAVLMVAAAAMTAAAAAQTPVQPPAQASASDQPSRLPARDVAVIYRINGVGMEGAHKVQITYTSRGERSRVDYFRWMEAKYPFLGIIFNRPADQLVTVMPERRAYVVRNIGKLGNPAELLKNDLRFAREGEAKVAELDCTDWKYRLSNTNDDLGTACITDEGLLLRLTSAKSKDFSLTATVVSFGSPPDSIFQPPPDFTRQKELR